MKKTLKMIVCSMAIANLLNAAVLHAQNITTVAGNGVTGYSGDGGAATLAKLYGPTGIYADGEGDVYIADNHNGNIRKMNPMGIITTIAGSYPAFGGDGGPATAALFYRCEDVVIDEAGNIYISDEGTGRIRKVNTAGIVNTIAGYGESNFAGDGGPATVAGFTIRGMTLDPSENLVFADFDNHRIRKINASGIITTIAGNGAPGYTGDGGPATAAAITEPTDVAYDAAGNLYISDYANSVVRKVDPSGIITTYAGTGIAGYNGDGGLAKTAMLHNPAGLAADAGGNLFICDKNNNRLRKVSPAGIITTAAGNGTTSFGGDDGPATSAGIGGITGVDIDNAGNIYITGVHARVRKIGNYSLQVSNTTESGIKLFPNPAQNTIHISATGKINAVITGMGKTIMSYTDVEDMDVSNLPYGVYIISLYNKQGELLKQEKLIKE